MATVIHAPALHAQSETPARANVSTYSPNILNPADSATYARYTVFPCVAVSSRMQRAFASSRWLTWRDRWPATNATRLDDTAATHANHNATALALRACLAHHPISTTPPRQLIGLGLAWLHADGDAEAEVAFTRALQTAASTSPVERAWLLSQIIGAYVGTTPEREAVALRYLKQLDALGAPAIGFRIAARNTLYGVAQAKDDLPSMTAWADSALRLSQTLTGDPRRTWIWEVTVAAVNRAALDSRRGNYRAAAERLTKDAADITVIEPQTGNMFGPELWKATHCGTAMKPLQSTFVFMPGQPSPVPTIARPALGKVSLFIRAEPVIWQTRPMEKYFNAQALVDQFGSQLDVVLVHSVTGVQNGNLVPAIEEAKDVQSLVHDYLNLTIPLVVWELPVTGKLPDGRLIRGEDPNYIGDFVLVDKRGIIRSMGERSPTAMGHMIEELLREP